MVDNPPKDMPRITPYLYYNDLAGAVEWLSRAFGLRMRFSLPDNDGHLMHAEMTFADGVVMMGRANPKEGGKSPLDLKAVHQGLYIYVDDVDAHCAHAKEAGARINMEPDDMFWGDRMYSASDLEGHQWSFAQHVRDVSPDELKPPKSKG